MAAASFEGWPPSSIPVTRVRVLGENENNAAENYPHVFSWSRLEKQNDVMTWSHFDTEAGALASHGVKTITWAYWVPPKWAVKENNRAATVSAITITSPAQVTVPGHSFTGNGTRIFFYGTGTLPDGLLMETDYCIVDNLFYLQAPTTFTLKNCNTGAPINITGGVFSGSVRATMSYSNPANKADVVDFISRLSKKVQALGMKLEIEGPNEWISPLYYSGGKNDLVTLQNWLWEAAKASGNLKVLMASTNSMFNIGSTGGYDAPFPPNVTGLPLADAFSIHGYNEASAGYNSTTRIAAPMDAAMTFARSKGFREFIVSEVSTEYDDLVPTPDQFNSVYFAQFVSLAVSRRDRGLSQVYTYVWAKETAVCYSGGWCQSMCSGKCLLPTGTPNATGSAWAQMIAWYVGTTYCEKPSMSADVQEMLCLRPNGSKQQTVWHSVYPNTSTYKVPPWAAFETNIAGIKTPIVGGVVALSRSPKLLTEN
jgi:hypothetical protein